MEKNPHNIVENGKNHRCRFAVRPKKTAIASDPTLFDKKKHPDILILIHLCPGRAVPPYSMELSV